MIRGIGIDIIEVDRIRRATVRWGDVFLSRVFTPRERGYAGASRSAAERLAGRFAAKEAVMKALGLGLRRMAWREIEIEGDPLGRPVVRLSGGAAEAAARLGVQAWFVSISHTRDLAVAHAVAE
ncbi:MAG TPA: holo-ACP synthase [bacterium]|nr:holo-ACP synthase [bacterium]